MPANEKILYCGKEEGLMDVELICRQPDENGVMCQKKATVQIILQGPGMIDSAEATNPLRLYVHICDEHALQLIKGYHEDIVGIKAIVP